MTKDGQYGGFYTQADIREIVAYAATRHITVIPEIEMPGHSQAALAAYPAISCTGGPFRVATDWGVHNDVYCAGKDATFDFLQNVASMKSATSSPAPTSTSAATNAPKPAGSPAPTAKTPGRPQPQNRPRTPKLLH